MIETMNRNDLKEKFNIIGENKDIMLFSKGPEKRGIGYTGSISLENGKAKFNGKSYGDVESLSAALAEWADGLEWPVDSYCPITNETYRLLGRITYYLTDKLGFVEDRSCWGDGYVYGRNIGPGYAIVFKIYNIKDEITITSKYASLTFSQKVNNIDEAVSMITNIVRSEILMMAKDMVSALSLLPEKEMTDVELFVDSKANIFGFEKVDFKSSMISLLEKELNALKGE